MVEFLLALKYFCIFEMLEKFEQQFKATAINTSLREEPDYKRIEELMLEIYSSLLL